jgi:hypothetical protein
MSAAICGIQRKKENPGCRFTHSGYSFTLDHPPRHGICELKSNGHDREDLLFETLGYIFVGVSIAAPWVMLAGLYLGRQWLMARIEKGVQYQFDRRIEELRSDFRKSEEQLKADLQSKESEISALRAWVLSGSAGRQALLDKRRFEAVEKVWTTVNDLGQLHGLASMMTHLNIEEVSKEAHDPRMQMVLKMIGATAPDQTRLKNVARDERPYLPELAWAYFSAYKSILYGSYMTYRILSSGGQDPARFLKRDANKEVLKAALPHQSKFIDENPPEIYYFLVEELQGLLLAELRKILEGKDADRDAVERAKSIMSVVSKANREQETEIAEATPDIA